MRGEPAAIGCDLGGTNLKTVLLQGRKLTFRDQVPVPREGTTALLAALSRAVRGAGEALDRSRDGSRPALGVAVPGFLSADRRRVVQLSNLPFLDGRPLAALLERRLGRRIRGRAVLDADSNAGAVGEAVLGAGRGTERVLYVTLGTGVGAALSIGGRPARVSNHTVGQVAHLPIDGGGPRCRCGARGCAEALLSAAGIVDRARRAKVAAPARKTPLDLAAAATRGDSAARRVFEETGALLGCLLAILANLFSPERIVVGGGIAQAAQLLLPSARRELRRRAHPRIRGRLQLLPGTLGPHAGAAGMAILARQALLESGGERPHR